MSRQENKTYFLPEKTFVTQNEQQDTDYLNFAPHYSSSDDPFVRAHGPSQKKKIALPFYGANPSGYRHYIIGNLKLERTKKRNGVFAWKWTETQGDSKNTTVSVRIASTTHWDLLEYSLKFPDPHNPNNIHETGWCTVQNVHIMGNEGNQYLDSTNVTVTVTPVSTPFYKNPTFQKVVVALVFAAAIIPLFVFNLPMWAIIILSIIASFAIVKGVFFGIKYLQEASPACNSLAKKIMTLVILGMLTIPLFLFPFPAWTAITFAAIASLIGSISLSFYIDKFIGHLFDKTFDPPLNRNYERHYFYSSHAFLLAACTTLSVGLFIGLAFAAPHLIIATAALKVLIKVGVALAIVTLGLLGAATAYRCKLSQSIPPSNPNPSFPAMTEGHVDSDDEDRKVDDNNSTHSNNSSAHSSPPTSPRLMTRAGDATTAQNASGNQTSTATSPSSS